MTIKKLKCLSEFKTALPLFMAEKIIAILPYENGNNLEKSSIKVLDAENGIIELTLSDFELQGLKVGPKQSFKVKVQMNGGDEFTLLFAGGLTVEVQGERKAWI